MEYGELRCIDLVKEYIWRVEKYNPYLRAISDYAPDFVHRALELDKLREEGQMLSPLHGISVLIKNVINTHPSFGMETTAGTFAFFENEPDCNVEVRGGVDSVDSFGGHSVSYISFPMLTIYTGTSGGTGRIFIWDLQRSQCRIGAIGYRRRHRGVHHRSSY